MPLGGAFWDAGAEVFINKGVNGRWRDTLTSEESAAYEAARRGGAGSRVRALARDRQDRLRSGPTRQFRTSRHAHSIVSKIGPKCPAAHPGPISSPGTFLGLLSADDFAGWVFTWHLTC